MTAFLIFFVLFGVSYNAFLPGVGYELDYDSFTFMTAGALTLIVNLQVQVVCVSVCACVYVCVCFVCGCGCGCVGWCMCVYVHGCLGIVYGGRVNTYTAITCIVWRILYKLLTVYTCPVQFCTHIYSMYSVYCYNNAVCVYNESPLS